MLSIVISEIKNAFRGFKWAMIGFAQWIFRSLIGLGVWMFFLSFFMGGGVLAWKFFHPVKNEAGYASVKQVSDKEYKSPAARFEPVSSVPQSDVQERLRAVQFGVRTIQSTVSSIFNQISRHERKRR